MRLSWPFIILAATSCVFSGTAIADTCEGDRLPLPDSKALPAVRKLAEGGDAHAQAQLGAVYLRGQGVKPDTAAGLSWLKKSAAAGSSEGQYLLAGYYAQTAKSQEDYRKAADLLKQSAAQGCLAGITGLGMITLKGNGVSKDSQAGIAMITKAADRGYSQAQMLLGILMVTGDGISKDTQKGFEWVSRAADSDDSAAQLALSALYMEGTGTPKKPEAARSLLNHVLAKKDDQAPNAAHSLGWMYMEGKGIPEDKTRALELMAYAATFHVSDSTERVKKLVSDLPNQKLVNSCGVYMDPEFAIHGAKEFIHANAGETVIRLRSYSQSASVYFPKRALTAIVPKQCLAME